MKRFPVAAALLILVAQAAAGLEDGASGAVELHQCAALADPSLAPPFSDEALAVNRSIGDRVKTSDTASALEAELDTLVGANDKKFLLETLARISPAKRIQELLAYEERQHQLGGGFHGLLPSPLGGVETLPQPADAISILKTAVFLAQRRQENRSALREVLPSFPFGFRGGSIPDSGAAAPKGWRFTIDDSAIKGFLSARADGAITPEEAGGLAGLDSNREMLRHRKNLGYVPEPLPSVYSLAEMIASAGSTDPLDRLWAWLHPWNFFGYADLAMEAEGYGQFVAEMGRHGERLEASVLSRIAAHAPEGTRFEGAFALTIGCLIRGWATSEMPGLNVDQVKDDWQFLDRVMTHETYHKLQLQICPTLTGEPAVGFDDLAVVDLGDPRQEKLYEILAYTVLEGTANFAAGPDGKVDSPDNARAGAELLADFVHRVLGEGDLEAADELIVQGLRNDGPLYALGYQLSAGIAREEGTRAVGEWLSTGPVSFFLQANSLARAEETALLPDEVVAAVKDLQKLIR